MSFEAHVIDRVPSTYGMGVGDIDGDGLTDIAAGSIRTPMIAWYRAPDWTRRVISAEHLGTIGVAPHDIDGDGRVEVALASGFNQPATGYLHWMEPPDAGDGPWADHPIGPVPFLHRIAWADVDGDGRMELIAASIRGGDRPWGDWTDPGALLFYKVPADPRRDPWEPCVIAEDLYIHHGLSIADLDGDGRPDILVGCTEGLIWFEPPRRPSDSWGRHVIGSQPCSEAAIARFDGRLGVASVEPWHGHELAWYEAPSQDLRAGPWTRHPIDDTLVGGHTLACADLDGDGRTEVVTGSFKEATDLRVYRWVDLATNRWERLFVDLDMGPGQSAILDLDGDERPDIVASGLRTNNLKWYRNIG